MNEIPYQVYFTIVDKDGNIINKIGPQEKVKEKESNVGIEVGGLNVVAVKPGYYTLRINIEDGENVVIGEKHFRIQSADSREVEEAKDYFSETEKQYYDRIEYIASDKELSEYKALSDTGKIEFLKRFWLRRDPNRVTPENEAIQVFIERINYAEDNFSSPFKQGYYTDRGRIYIKYGPPETIERHPFKIDFDPYEVWEYFSYGGYRFIFSDFTGDGEFFLVFSSTGKEPSFANWKKYAPEDKGVMQGEQ